MGSINSEPTQVVLGKINPLDGECLRLAFEALGKFQVVGVASSTQDLLQLVRASCPQIVVVEVGLPGTQGLRTVRILHSACPGTKVMVMLGAGYGRLIQWALRAGADGVFCLTESVSELITGVNRLRDRGTYLSPRVAASAFRSLRKDESVISHDDLSKREFEVIRLLIEGCRMTEIAQKLHISVKTASTHKTHLFEKLGLVNLKDLLLYAVDHELFPLRHAPEPIPAS